MSSKGAEQRLKKEYKRLQEDPLPSLIAAPKPSDYLEWHFVLQGINDTPYANGHYHGKLKFPSSYPFAPPSIMLITPSGRFETNKRICFSMSDFHPEQWRYILNIITYKTILYFLFPPQARTYMPHSKCLLSFSLHMHMYISKAVLYTYLSIYLSVSFFLSFLHFISRFLSYFSSSSPF